MGVEIDVHDARKMALNLVHQGIKTINRSGLQTPPGESIAAERLCRS
jgi:hypothetical protein